MDKNDICLILPYEQNKKVLNDFNIAEDRFYEEELVKCIKYWRMNAGKFKDISIYAVNLHNLHMSESIHDTLINYNVQTISNNMPKSFITDKFCSIPFLGMFCEQAQQIKEHILVKIDVDMYMLKELPEEHIKNAIERKIVIGQYDKFTVPDSRVMYGDIFPLTTDYIICDKRIGFYKKYYNALLDLMVNKKNELLAKTEYFIDELATDQMYAEKQFNFSTVQHYEVKGEYGENDIAEYIRHSNKFPTFLHYHLTRNKAADFKIFNFLRTLNNDALWTKN